MLQEQIERRARKPAHIDALRLRQAFAQVGAHDPLVPGLGTESRLAQARIDAEIQIRPRDIGLVEIERILFGRIAEQLEAVFAVVPIDGRREMQRPLPLRFDGSEGLQRVLELIVEPGTVEGAGSEILVADTGLPADLTRAEIVRAVREGLDRAEIAVQPAGRIAAEAVAALVARRNAAEASVIPERCRSRSAERTERPALQAGADGFVGGFARDNVHGAQERRRAVDAGCRPLEDFNALDVAEVHGKIERIVPRLGVGDIDAVEQHSHLVIGAAADADVGLHAHCAALTDVNAQGIFEQVIDRLGRRRGDGQTVHEGDDAGTAVKCHGNTGRRNRHFVDGLHPGLGSGRSGRQGRKQEGGRKKDAFFHKGRQRY